MSSRFRAVSVQNHTLYAPAGGVAPVLGPRSVRSCRNRTRNLRPRLHTGPSARTPSGSGIVGGKKGATSPLVRGTRDRAPTATRATLPPGPMGASEFGIQETNGGLDEAASPREGGTVSGCDFGPTLSVGPSLTTDAYLVVSAQELTLPRHTGLL